MPNEVTDTLSIDYAWGGVLNGSPAASVPLLSRDERLYVSEWRDSYTIQGTVILLMVALLLSIRKIVSLTPYLIGCLVRMKELLNLENILKISRRRDSIAFLSVLSFSLLGARYRFVPGFCPEGTKPVEVLGMLLGTAAVCVLLRKWACAAFSGWTGKGAAHVVLKKSAYTYFIIYTAFLCIVTGCLYIWGIRTADTYRSAALATGAAVWIIYVVREIQIFMHWNCSPYPSFLYLCTLDFVPMGVITYLTVAY